MEIIMTNFEKEKEAAAKAPTAVTTSAPKTGLISEKIFDLMKTFLARGEGKHLIPKVKSVFGFEILEKKGQKPALIYEIDLKNG